ncbi:S-adenosyl-L-methionine-dependent methyltransferase, partial [Amylocystis lapponica]
MNNPHLFKGKTVLDVGCGTGILSMFAAKAGAKHVVGCIDMSNIIDQAVNIIEANGFKDRFTLRCSHTLVKGKLEDSMLDTVLLARDRYLKPGGLIFPDNATLYLAAIEDADYKDEKINCDLGQCYGFDYSCIKDIALREPLVDTVELKAVTTDPCMIKQLTFVAPFSLTATRNDYVHAFLAWFDISFECTHTNSPCPFDSCRQTVFYTPQTLTVSQGQKITGRLSCAPNARNNRDLDILITYRTGASEPETEIQYK